MVDVAAPDICLSFGGSSGRDDLRRDLAAGPERWDALRTLLMLGGTWDEPDVFAAPYVYSAWPDGHDTFDEQAIVGAGVRVRAAARPDAAVITSLSDCIVRVADAGRRTEDWTPIDLRAKRVGYVSTRHIRSPINYRAAFEFKDARWQMTFFLAGD